MKCTHLLYCDAAKSEQKVLECFKKCLKIADVCWNSHQNNHHLTLFVAILNKFLQFLNIESFQSIKMEDVQKCIDFVKSKREGLAKEPNAEELRTYWEQTVRYIEFKRNTNPRYQSLKL